MTVKIIAVVAVLFFPTAGIAQEPMIRASETIKLATVAVACAEKESRLTNDIKLVSIQGTGFFVSENGTFLTAGHVAKALYLESPEKTALCPMPVIYFPEDGWKSGFNVDARWFKISGCEFDDSLDLAACKTYSSPFVEKGLKIKPAVVAFDTSLQKEGTPIAFTGFPLQVIQPITAIGTVAGYGSVPGETQPREIIIDHNNWPGAGGSAVYLSNGRVVGLLLKRGLNDAVGLAFARSSSFIVQFLAKHNIGHWH